MGAILGMLRGLGSGLTMSALNAAESTLSGSSYLTHYQKYVKSKNGGNTEFVYVNNRDSRSVAVRETSRLAFQLTEHYKNKIIDWAEYNTTYRLKHLAGYLKARKALESQKAASMSRLMEDRTNRAVREKILEKQKTNVQKLISEQFPENSDLGTLTCDGGKVVTAMTPYGDKVVDAMFLSFDGEDAVQVTVPVRNPSSGKYDKTDTFNTRTRFFYDLAPSVSQSTTKNVVLTKVQGRDQSRKELVSGGDAVFNVSGSINSDKDGVYPSVKVSRFIEIMQHNGVINVSHFLFRQFNVTRVVIQDFKLDAPTYKNIQPYSFTCVGVEPNDAVSVKADTISVINDVLASSGNEGWYKSMLATKLDRLNSQGTEAETSPISQALDKNI